jgi:hypothetical protein
MLMVIGAIGPFWPPMHLRGTVTTVTDTLHVVFASIVSVLILLAIAFGAGASGKRFRAYSIATFALLIVFGSLTFLYAPAMAANLPTPWVGLFERINVGGYLLWVAVLATVLLRQPVLTTELPARGPGSGNADAPGSVLHPRDAYSGIHSNGHAHGKVVVTLP